MILTEWNIHEWEHSEIGCGSIFLLLLFWFWFSLCYWKSKLYKSIFCFNRYNSEHISESFCADWGDRSFLWAIIQDGIISAPLRRRHGPAHQLWCRPRLLGIFDKHTEPRFLICKERFWNDFPKVIQLISIRLRVSSFMCVALQWELQWDNACRLLCSEPATHKASINGNHCSYMRRGLGI